MYIVIDDTIVTNTLSFLLSLKLKLIPNVLPITV